MTDTRTPHETRPADATGDDAAPSAPRDGTTDRPRDERRAVRSGPFGYILKPIDERAVFGKAILLFDGVPRAQLAALGETRNVGIADLFVATMKGTYA